MNSVMYREITPFSDAVDRWNDVTINAGASQSTLQDIKLPEVAGFFTYSSSADLSSCCSNRFIYWRTNHDVIELVEISLDVNLRNNHLRLRFQNTPILRGVSIHENSDEVVLLVATVSAIHKLVFPHPKVLEIDGFPMKKTDSALFSVFHDTSVGTLRNRSCYFVLNHVSLGIPLPHTSCSWLDTDGNATFVLANSAGSVLMMVMSDKHGVEISTTELMKTGSIFRIFNGLVPSAIRSNRTEVALSIVCHHTLSDILVFALFSDLQIRMWSHRKQECLFVESILNFDSEKRLSAGNFTAHQCHLRKSVPGFRNNIYLGVYVPVPHQKIFYLFKPILEHDRNKLVLISTLCQTRYDLVDFCIGETRIWTLWLSCENQPIVFTASVDRNQDAELNVSWVPVDLEPRVSRTIGFGASNPHDAYMKEIFKVGRFLPSTITKAISIYHTAKNTSFSSTLSMKIDDLRNRVLEAVEGEIVMKVGDIEATEKEYLDAATECWDRFFSYCIQYHEVGMKPLGISVDPYTGCVIIIKKNFYSLLCPCDPLELLTNSNFRNCLFSTNLLDEEDRKLYYGLKVVLACVDLVHETVDEMLLLGFEEKLFNSFSPLKYTTEICKSLDLGMDSQFLKEMRSLLPSDSDIISSLRYLLKKLDLSCEVNDTADISFSKYPSFACSSSGVAALCSGLSHFAKQRFEFCRDLLMFEVILWYIDTMEHDQLDIVEMQSTIIPQTVVLVRSYYIILWCTQCECVSVPLCIQEAAFKQFCVLELPEFTNSDLTLIKPGCTVSNLFFQEDGGSKARKIMELRLVSLNCEEDWAFFFPSFVVAAAMLLWPLEGNLFPEFLFARCQFFPLQEYDRLVQGWCAWNKQFLNFLVASSFLILGDSHKALKLFLDVSNEIEGESYVCNRLLKGRYNSASSVMSLFCMRVIQMFEQFSLSDCVVKLSSAAINEVDETDPHVPIFYSVLFKHHLNLGHSEDAFKTLIKNPDASRRKDCLRQLIVKLCESKQFQKIIDLSYMAFDEEVISILESRARCSDLCHNTSFYEILYALHVQHKKFRKAASIMYELAMRFGREVISLKGLKKQASCYLAAINCLHLAEEKYAWIVKPTFSAPESLDSFDDPDFKNSPKRNADGNEIFHSTRPVKVKVLGLQDILREYTLIQARILYAQKHHSSSGLVITPLTPEETVALLLNACLYETAVHLSKCFSLSLVPVFEALTYRCISSNLRSEVHVSEEFGKETRYKANDSVLDVANNNMGSSRVIWHLLKTYLFQYEASGKTDLHKSVTEKLLIQGAALPAWLKLSYQKRNFTELLNLYISHGLLEDALVLVCKYIKAVLGVRKEDFDLKFSLHSNSPAVWVPHTYIDILLDAAVDLQDDERFRDLYQDLNDTLVCYNKTVESITMSKLSDCSI